MTCWFCLMYHLKKEISIRHFLSLFTFLTGSISFKAGGRVSIEAARSKLNLYSSLISQLKKTYEDTLKLLWMYFQVSLVTSANFLHEDKLYNQWNLRFKALPSSPFSIKCIWLPKYYPVKKRWHFSSTGKQIIKLAFAQWGNASMTNQMHAPQ